MLGRGACRLTLYAPKGAAFKQKRQVSSRGMRAQARMHAPRPALLATARWGVNSLSGRRFARPHKARPSKAMARVVGPPHLAAPAAGRLRGGMRACARMLRGLARRSCLSVAPLGAQRVLRRTPQTSRCRLPRCAAAGSQTAGALSLPPFLCAQERGSPAGASPGLCLQTCALAGSSFGLPK